VTPYYQDDHVTIYHGDCREITEWLSADVMVTDPPYGETSLDWDSWPVGWPGLSTAARQLWCFGSMRMFLERSGEFATAGWHFAQDVVWEKHNGSSFHADRFRRVHEHATHWYRGPWGDLDLTVQTTPDATPRTVRRKARPAHTGHIDASSYASNDGGPRMMRSVMQVRSEHGRAEHPTQKPVGIVTPLLAYTGGVLVADPFMGSGTTLRAAKDLGRKAIGIEVEERYCEIAARRMGQEVLAL